MKKFVILVTAAALLLSSCGARRLEDAENSPTPSAAVKKTEQPATEPPATEQPTEEPEQYPKKGTAGNISYTDPGRIEPGNYEENVITDIFEVEDGVGMLYSDDGMVELTPDTSLDTAVDAREYMYIEMQGQDYEAFIADSNKEEKFYNGLDFICLEMQMYDLYEGDIDDDGEIRADAKHRNDRVVREYWFNYDNRFYCARFIKYQKEFNAQDEKYIEEVLNSIELN